MPSFEPTSNGTTNPYASYLKEYKTSIGAAADLVELSLLITESPLFPAGPDEQDEPKEAEGNFDVNYMEQCQEIKERILSKEEWGALIQEWVTQAVGKMTISEQVTDMFSFFENAYPVHSRRLFSTPRSPTVGEVDDCWYLLSTARHVAAELERVYMDEQAAAGQ